MAEQTESLPELVRLELKELKGHKGLQLCLWRTEEIAQNPRFASDIVPLAYLRGDYDDLVKRNAPEGANAYLRGKNNFVRSFDGDPFSVVYFHIDNPIANPERIDADSGI